MLGLSRHRRPIEPASSSQRWWSPFCEVGSITVSRVDLAPHASREESALSWLDRDEVSRSRRFLYPGPIRRFVLCRSALRAILCGELGCENRQLTFGEGRYGKPYAMLRDKPITAGFNVSHSGEHGLIAFAPHGRLGVDVEERVAREDIDSLSKMVFGPDEQSALASARGRRKIDMFFKFWTIKEALIKAVGTGFSLDPSSFEIPSAMYSGASSWFRFPQAPATKWRIAYIGNEEFAAAVAYEAVARPSMEQSAPPGELRPAGKGGVR